MNPNFPRPRAVIGCERLEARENPAGNVTATVVGNDLFVVGDGDPAGNQAGVYQDAGGNVFVYGINGTTVNGQPSVYVGTGVPNRISMQLGGAGPDFVEVCYLSVATVDVFTGGGDDYVYLHDMSAGSVYVDAGNGNDTVDMRTVSTQFGGNVSGGAGFDTFNYGVVYGPPFIQQFERAIPVG